MGVRWPSGDAAVGQIPEEHKDCSSTLLVSSGGHTSEKYGFGAKVIIIVVAVVVSFLNEISIL